jgi:nucleotidyltransferase/DNA polymerase involved in DNA repair
MFFAAVAELDNPKLKGKPVAVGGYDMIGKHPPYNKIYHYSL